MSFHYTAWTGGQSANGGSLDNRRAFVRYQCGLATPGRLQLQSEEWIRAWVLDMCVSGAGLLLNRQLESGLQVILHMVNTAQKKVHEITAIVRHATLQSDGDWLIGCEFASKLSDDDLEALLA